MSTKPTVLAQLRHLYQNMLNGGVRDTASAKRIAEGLLGPAIEALERGTPAMGGEPVGTVVHNTAADAQFAPRAVWPLNNFHDLPLGTKLYTSPQPVREPLSTVELMRVVMKADEETRGFALRGTTNWAAHIGKAVQNAVRHTAPPVREPLGRDAIREIFMQHGFTIKDGQDDLKQYVYDAADALLAAHGITKGEPHDRS